MSKQTAVEWLVEQITEYDFSPRENTYLIEIPSWILKEKINEAKSMEKEQMIDIGSHCFARGHKGFQPIESDAEPTAEEYYYETYKGGEDAD